MSRKDFKSILKAIREDGGVVTISKNGHYRIDNPETGRWCHMSFSPSDRRANLNAIAQLRRIGLLRRKERAESREADLCR